MTVSLADRTLIIKEIRQNIVLYIFPGLFLLGVALFHYLNPELFPKSWTNIIALVFPIALAASYGLQSFDLEENNQTRDFLLTKPLTIPQMIWAKYLTGFTLLVITSLAWFYILLPTAFQLPSFIDFSGIGFVFEILFVLIIYTMSFVAGALIKGPIKLLGAIFLSIVTASWFFLSWFQFLAFLILKYPGSSMFLGWITILFLMTVFLFGFIVRLTISLIEWHLRNTAYPMVKKRLLNILSFIIIMPTIMIILNITEPAVKPFNNLFLINLSKGEWLVPEEWFVAKEGVYQPGGDLYAFRDGFGRLGMGRYGEKPKVIYKGERPKDNSVSQLCWSPDGKALLFCENKVMKVYNLRRGNITVVCKGDNAIWSADSKQLLVEIDVPNKKKSKIFTQQELYLIDYIKRRSLFLGVLTSPVGASLGWDSKYSRLLSIQNQWDLKVINLTQNSVLNVKLTPPQQAGPVFYSRILPLPQTKDQFMIAIFCMTNNTTKKYNIYFYRFNALQNNVRLVSKFLNLTYKDIIIQSTDRILGQFGNGAYWLRREDH